MTTDERPSSEIIREMIQEFFYKREVGPTKPIPPPESIDWDQFDYRRYSETVSPPTSKKP